MKKYILSLMAASLIASCTSTPTLEEQARSLIKDYITENAHNPATYEAVSFGTLDSIFSSYAASERYKELNSLCDSFNSIYTAYMDALNFDSAKAYLDKKHDIYRTMNEESDTYKGHHIGFQMSHRYRAASKIGAISLGTTVFYFDKEITRITRTKNEN